MGVAIEVRETGSFAILIRMFKDPRFSTPERPRIPQEVQVFIDSLADVSDSEHAVTYDGETYEIDADDFNLSFTIDQDERRFEIRNIEAPGLGRLLVESIHQYADEHGYEVYASNVRDDATGFWEKMGYEESETPGEYFRPQ